MKGTVAISPRILNRRQVLAITGLSHSSLYRRIATGDFPEQYRLGGPGNASVGWKEKDVMMWLDELKPRNLSEPQAT